MPQSRRSRFAAPDVRSEIGNCGKSQENCGKITENRGKITAGRPGVTQITVK